MMNSERNQSSLQSIVLASGNAGKLREFNLAFNSLPLQIRAQSEFQVPEVAETGLSFVENALLKARHASEHTGLPALADDSGLAVWALGGAPGVYSARYAGEPSNSQANNEKLLTALSQVPKPERQAEFICVLALLRHPKDPTPIICQARWQGEILESLQGKGGFGYDPLFYVPSQQCSAAQLSPEVKNQLSHRGQAIQQLLQQLPQWLKHG